MTILTERKTWTKKRDPASRRRTTSLTHEEQERVVAALRVLSVQHGNAYQLSLAMGVGGDVVRKVLKGSRRASAGLAVQAARLAGVGVGELLAGAWPGAGRCPHCGMGAEEAPRGRGAR